MAKENSADKQIPAITTPDGKQFEIPVQGSLGLLALGYRGLVAWRAKRDAVRG